MSLARVFGALSLAASIAACASLPVSLPGQESVERAEPVVAEPEPPVQAETVADPANGVAGAALCIASAFYLADSELMSEEQALTAAEVWTGILDVIPSTNEARQAAVDDAYAALEGLDDRTDQGGLRTATFNYSAEGTCADQASQRDFLARFGDPGLMEQQLGGGS